jgi:hypothetical protein
LDLHEDGGALVARLCFAGPLLYVALTMLTTPARFLEWVAALVLVVRSFEQRLHGSYWQTPCAQYSGATPRMLLGVRISG